MTIEKHISAIRALLRKYDETDDPFSDEQLYHYFNTAAVRLVTQKLEREKKYNFTFFCIPMEKGYVHECACLNVGCEVMRSVQALPEPITTRAGMLFKVMDLDFGEIPYIEPQRADSINLDPVREGKVHYSWINGHIVLWNTDGRRPLAIQVGAVVADPTQWANIDACDRNGNEAGSCYNVATDDYPITGDLVYEAYRHAIQLMGITLQLEEDRINEQS